MAIRTEHFQILWTVIHSVPISVMDAENFWRLIHIHIARKPKNKPQKQAVAIALNVARKDSKKK